MADPRAALISMSRSLLAASVVAVALVVTAAFEAKTSVVTDPPGEPAHAGKDRASRSRWSFTRMERCFLKKVNRSRARQGLRPLNWDRQIGYVARRHASKMARHGGISHDMRLGRKVTQWRTLGQNSGAGRRCSGLFRAFLRSSGHRSNIMGRWRFMGVGVRRRNNRIYVQQVFEFRTDPGNIYGYP
jgi:uncharacterized protein YkwD